MNKEQNKNNLLISLPIILTLALVVGILGALLFFKDNRRFNRSNDSNLKKFREVINLIEREYVDEVNVDELTESAIEEILDKLDPHSTYIAFEDKEINDISFESNYQGIGIEFNILKDTLVVISPLSGGPSEKLGIMAGDRIVKIDGENITGIGLDNKMVFDRLRGPKDSKVDLDIVRKGKKGVIAYEIKRDEIPSISVDAGYMINEQMAYVKISRFTENTALEFRDKIKTLNEEGMKKLILDLRNNSGGILSSALFIVDEMLEDDKLILYTKGKSEQNNFEYKSRLKGQFEKGELMVLINEGSASASEIVAGALQDQDRATIIGRRSFGKGLVQSSFDLNDGSELRMTISRYYIPSGRSIQKPYSDNRKEYSMDIINRYDNGEFFHVDSIDLPDSLIFKTALGRKVYGGGGIMPDIFIPTDTSYRSDFLLDLNSKGILYEYAFDYANANRGLLKKMGEDNFVNNFKIDRPILQKLYDFAQNEGLEYNVEQAKRSEEMIRTQLKALISRNLWRDNGFYKVYNPIDPTYKKAILEMQNVN